MTMPWSIFRHTNRPKRSMSSKLHYIDVFKVNGESWLFTVDLVARTLGMYSFSVGDPAVVKICYTCSILIQNAIMKVIACIVVQFSKHQIFVVKTPFQVSKHDVLKCPYFEE